MGVLLLNVSYYYELKIALLLLRIVWQVWVQYYYGRDVRSHSGVEILEFGKSHLKLHSSLLREISPRLLVRVGIKIRPVFEDLQVETRLDGTQSGRSVRTQAQACIRC